MTDINREEVIERTEDAIDETRERVRERINRIQHDFSPQTLLNQIFPEGQPMTETIRQVTDAARRNPVATALIAGGVALLGKDIIAAPASRAGRRAASAGKQYAADVSRSVKRGSADIAEQTTELLDEAKQTASAAAGKINREAGKAYAGAADAGQELLDAGTSYARTGKRWIEDNPVAAGLAAAAAGALVATYFAARQTNETSAADERAGEPSGRLSAVKSRKQAKTRAASSSSRKTAAAKKQSSNRKPAARKRASSAQRANGSAKRPGPVAPLNS